jgi:hypothetical protein
VVAQLTEANSCFAKQLEDNALALKEVKALLKKERAECAGSGNSDRPPRRTFTPSADNYCWYLGYKVASTHTIQTCLYPKDVHKREATKANNMGGYQAIRDLLLGATSKNSSENIDDCWTQPLLKNDKTALLDSGCTGFFFDKCTMLK